MARFQPFIRVIYNPVRHGTVPDLTILVILQACQWLFKEAENTLSLSFVQR